MPKSSSDQPPQRSLEELASQYYPQLSQDPKTVEVTPQQPPVKETTGHLAAQYFPEAGSDLNKPWTPEVRRLTSVVSFAIAFASISPFVLIVTNWIVVNVFSWTSIPDMVLIAYIVSASLSAVVQPIIAKILEKVVGK